MAGHPTDSHSRLRHRSSNALLPVSRHTSTTVPENVEEISMFRRWMRLLHYPTPRLLRNSSIQLHVLSIGGSSLTDSSLLIPPADSALVDIEDPATDESSASSSSEAAASFTAQAGSPPHPTSPRDLLPFCLRCCPRFLIFPLSWLVSRLLRGAETDSALSGDEANTLGRALVDRQLRLSADFGNARAGVYKLIIPEMGAELLRLYAARTPRTDCHIYELWGFIILLCVASGLISHLGFMMYTFTAMLRVHVRLGRLFERITDVEVRMAMEDGRLPYGGLFMLLQIFTMLMLFTAVVILPSIAGPRCGAVRGAGDDSEE